MRRAEPTVHGVTCNGYTNYGCRCDLCRAAWNAYCKKRRVERSKNIPADIHGNASTYYNYMCRCADCRAANTAYYRKVRKRAKITEKEER